MAFIAEEDRRAKVGHDDQPVAVEGEHRVGSGVEQFDENPVGKKSHSTTFKGCIAPRKVEG